MSNWSSEGSEAKPQEDKKRLYGSSDGVGFFRLLIARRSIGAACASLIPAAFHDRLTAFAMRFAELLCRSLGRRFGFRDYAADGTRGYLRHKEASYVGKESHEAKVHMEVLMTMEQG